MARVETGAVRIDDDWPGVFIRGDDCMKAKVDLLALSQNADHSGIRLKSLLGNLRSIMEGDFEFEKYRRKRRQQLYTMIKPEDQRITIKNGRKTMELSREQAAHLVEFILETMSDPFRRSHECELG